ncbi:MAG: AAA family ATPase, partial [Solirubrobacterales bacterium]|nr:AAA family ATPase [Solirubrobacterales bacterium]
MRLRSRVLVGREPELALLGDALLGAAAGEPAALVLTGDAGVGKSRLLDEARVRAEAAGFLALCGHAAPLSGGAAPLLPVADALGGVRERLPGEAWRALADGLPAGVAWLVSGVAPPAGDGAGMERTQVLELVVRLLRRLAAARPVLLTVDDVQWADGSTRDLLAYAVRALRDERLLVAVAIRGEELSGDAALRTWTAELARAPRARRLDLGPLGRDAVAEQLADLLGAAPPDELAERVFARSGGNPFLAEELVAAAGDGDALPGSLRELLLARTAGLTVDARRLVRAAAAAGRSCDPRLPGGVAGRDADALDAALADAVAHAVLVSDGARVAFRHDLVRDQDLGLETDRERVGQAETHPCGVG